MAFSLKKIGRGIRKHGGKVLGAAGDIGKLAIPLLAATGVGTPVAMAAAAAAAGLAGTSNDKGGFNLGRGLMQGAASGASSYLAGGGKVPGMDGLRNAVGLGRGAGPVPGGAPGAAAAGGAAKRGGFNLGNALGVAAQGLGIKNPDGSLNAGNLFKTVGGAAATGMGMYQSHKAGKQRDELVGAQTDLAKRQGDTAEGLLDEMAPLRKAANTALMDRMKKPRTLGHLRDRANPFAASFAPGAA